MVVAAPNGADNGSSVLALNALLMFAVAAGPAQRHGIE